MNHLIAPVVRPLTWWAQECQRNSCRNAMVASTALAERRQERNDVQDYLDQALGRVAQGADHRTRAAG